MVSVIFGIEGMTLKKGSAGPVSVTFKKKKFRWRG